MKIKTWIIIVLIVSLSSSIHGQTRNPRLWYLGYQSPARDTNSLDTGFFLQAGSSVLDFRTTAMKQFRVGNTLSVGDCNAFIFDENDSIVLYTNGSKVFNRKHRLIEAADSLNYGPNDWTPTPFKGSYYSDYYISLFNQAIIALPYPSKKGKYSLVSIFINGDDDTFHKITHSVVDMNLNGGNGKMTLKEETVALGDFTESINAVRHGNGKDWWLIAREYATNNCFTIMLLDSNGIRVVSRNQCTGFDLKDRNAVKRNGINKFSWDGKYFVSLTFRGIEFYSFNRCTGTLSNRRKIDYIDSLGDYLSGSFSPNSKYFYINNTFRMYQVDMSSLGYKKVGEWDGFMDSTGGFPYTTGFGIGQLAADNKLYYSTGGAFTHYLHVIDKPNVAGIGCNVIQRAVKIQTLNSGIPHHPNFELGIDTCWRSGLEDADIETVKIYPNPVSDILYIEYNAKNLVIRIFNHIGQRMISEQNARQLDLRGLASGIYYLEILDSNYQIIKRETIVKR
jgi:hypothetical protein